MNVLTPPVALLHLPTALLQSTSDNNVTCVEVVPRSPLPPNSK